jgi:hypothetical protein
MLNFLFKVRFTYFLKAIQAVFYFDVQEKILPKIEKENAF